ncbi:unnamed protein product [Umbelopsis ramanniana]
MVNKDADALSCKQNTQAQETTIDLTLETIKAKTAGRQFHPLTGQVITPKYPATDGGTLTARSSNCRGHLGRDGTASKVKDICWWPHMNDHIKEYMQELLFLSVVEVGQYQDRGTQTHRSILRREDVGDRHSNPSRLVDGGQVHVRNRGVP